MAIYRNVQMSFWTDTKIDEDFTPEDKYFYLYLFTNPHTNLCGCYELGLKQASRETGYNEDTIARLIDRFENVHNVVAYSKPTREILILNWHKYNWTKSAHFMSGLEKHIGKVKNPDFKEYLNDLSNGVERVYRRSTDRGETSVTVTVTDTVTDTETGTKSKKETAIQLFNRIIPAYIISDPLADKMRDWIAYKEEKKETYKEIGLKALLKRVQGEEKQHGTVAVMNLVDECMENNWKGIIWDRLTKKQSNKKNDFDEWGQMLDDERRRNQTAYDD